MIIGISGKIGSGKDTVGKIIQYLINSDLIKEMSFKDFNKSYSQNFLYEHDWQIKKFASKLKQIVSILTGIPIEDLEKQEIKNKVLGEEWERWYNYHYKLKTNNNPKGRLDNYCATQIEVEKQHNLISNSISEHSFTVEKLTVRKLLQEIGTDAMRDVIHPNIWINALFSDYKPIGDYPIIKEDKYIKDEYIYPNWIITDVRFPNELEAIKDKKGISIRLEREQEFSMFNEEAISKHSHPSETALDNAEFDYVIDNNGTIEELIEKVKEILIKEKII
ncbi:MAG: hypothetical protein EKK61_03795 [Rickettsiales bacterium]|nr:MAG: hypothetical protein EKK61_03795 [Rickettsiales bacterium]